MAPFFQRTWDRVAFQTSFPVGATASPLPAGSRRYVSSSYVVNATISPSVSSRVVRLRRMIA